MHIIYIISHAFQSVVPFQFSAWYSCLKGTNRDILILKRKVRKINIKNSEKSWVVKGLCSVECSPTEEQNFLLAFTFDSQALKYNNQSSLLPYVESPIHEIFLFSKKWNSWLQIIWWKLEHLPDKNIFFIRMLQETPGRPLG